MVPEEAVLPEPVSVAPIVSEIVDSFVGVPKFDTVKKAEQWANENGLADKVDYSGIEDPKIANRINETMSELKEKYKTVSLDSLRVSDMGDDDRFAEVVRFTSSGGGQAERHSYVMEFNSRHWKTPEAYAAWVEHNSARDWITSVSSKDTITHEFGHLLDFQYGSNKVRQNMFKDRRNDLSLISNYAQINHREMVAEAFVHYNRGGAEAMKNIGGVDWSEFIPFFKKFEK